MLISKEILWSPDESEETGKGPSTASAAPGLRRLSYLTDSSSDTMGGGVGHRVGLHLRVALQQGFDCIQDAGILLALVALRVLFIVPEAKGELALPSIFRFQRNQVDKPRLFLQDGKHLVAQLVFELFLSFRFHVAFHNACKHGGNSFRIFLEGEVFPARRHGGSKISLHGGEVAVV